MREILQGFIKAEGKKSSSAGGQENVPIKFFKTVVCNLGQEKLTKTFQGEKGSWAEAQKHRCCLLRAK